jgi:hypothetical protein
MPIRKRLHYLVFVIGVILLGLLSREISWFPMWLGDVLWGLMVFFIAGFLFRKVSTLSNALSSAIFSTGVEMAKLLHTPWLDAFRYTRIGGLILGYVFSFNNILCYIIGIIIGVTCEYLWISPKRVTNKKNYLRD